MVEGGIFVWESDEDPATAWERIPPRARQAIIEKKIRVFILPGFDIAKRATSRPELQLRMQGNSFLGAFFKLSSLLADFDITEEHYRQIVRAQYVKKFGRFGQAVVESNMQVMTQGGERLVEVTYGDLEGSRPFPDARGGPHPQRRFLRRLWSARMHHPETGQTGGADSDVQNGNLRHGIPFGPGL